MGEVVQGLAWLGFPPDFPVGWSRSRWVERDGRMVQKGYFDGVHAWWHGAPYSDGAHYIDPEHQIWSYRGLPRSLPNRWQV